MLALPDWSGMAFPVFYDRPMSIIYFFASLSLLNLFTVFILADDVSDKDPGGHAGRTAPVPPRRTDKARGGYPKKTASRTLRRGVVLLR
jgi:hypothetical protein